MTTLNSSTNQLVKQSALTLADTIGQREALLRLFNFAPHSKANYWAVVDFNKPSNEARLFIFSLKENVVRKFFVSHGEGSGLGLIATNFSNQEGSHKSSLGIFKTLGTYIGGHGNSLQIDGLEASNNNAKDRYIVIHKADYVTNSNAGPSWGCFAVSNTKIDEVIDCLRDGSYLNAWHT